jgi:voltage-gated potassium channel Kch
MTRFGSRFFDDTGRGLDRFGLLLVITVLSVVTQELVDLHSNPTSIRTAIGAGMITIFSGATLLLAFRSSGTRRRWIRVADILVAIGVAATLLLLIASVADPDAATDVGRVGTPSVMWVVLTVLSPLIVIRRLLQHRRVSNGTLLGAVAVFLLIALAFDYLFLVADAYQAAPFFGQPEPSTSFMYFSIVTVTTLGYGDLTPATNLARLLATTEAVVGQVFLVTFVAMIVGLLAQDWRNRQARAAAEGTEAEDGPLFESSES